MIKSSLTFWLGRLPIGWLQLQHNRTRLFAAVGGVTFANVLIFMQLGFMNALFETSVMTHRMFAADVVIAASDYQTMREANPLPRNRMLTAAGLPGIVSAYPVYLGTITWTNPQTNDTTNFRVVGVRPEDAVFLDLSLQAQLVKLKQADTALVDARSRDYPIELANVLQAGHDYPVEMSGRKITFCGQFEKGASFDVDGSLIVSEQTFFRLFPKRSAHIPTFVMLKSAENTDPKLLAKRINGTFFEEDARAFSKEDFIAAEQDYQAKQSPIGFVFGFGVAMGLVVGLVIVYQVLSTDVQDHLSEYATFKAIGYPADFFRGIVIEESLCLSVLGFLPGLLIAITLYEVAANATALPISMPWTRPILVFSLTAMMCAISGGIATQRLQAADPADLF